MASDIANEDTKTTEPLSEEANIEKAIRFWKHPSLRDVPTDQKREYLHERGVTDAQIHKAWGRIAEEPTPDNNNNNNHQNNNTNQNQNNNVQATAPASQPNPLAGAAPAVQPSYPTQQQPPPFNRNPYNQSYDSQYAQQPQSANPYGGAGAGMYPPPPEEDEGPITLAQGATLVTLGATLGLTVAAAVRWLNGGDFKILPPPTYPDDTSHLVLEEASQEQHVEDEDYVDPDILEDDLMQGEEDESIEIMPTSQEKLLEQVQLLSATMQSHVSVQEKLLQKLTTKSSITDHSMDLLRSSTKVSSSEQTGMDKLAVWAKLVEIKAELSSLQRNTATDTNDEKSQWEEKLTNTLEHLDESLSKIAGSIGIEKVSTSPPSQEKPAVNAPKSTPPLATSTTPAAPGSTPSPPPSVTAPPDDSKSTEPKRLSLHESIGKLVEANEAIALRMGSQLLYLYIVNLSGRPDNPRYRKIYTCNENFKKVENLAGGKDLLYSLGFEERDTFLEWLPDADQDLEDATIEKLKEAAAALSILKSTKPSDGLLESVLATLSPEPLSDPPPPSSEEPQTPSGSCLVSPPMPKKDPDVPPSDTLQTTASDNDENAQLQPLSDPPPPSSEEPQTPSESCLVSPPMPTKDPDVLPSDTLQRTASDNDENAQLETAGSETSDSNGGASTNEASPKKSYADAMKMENGSS
jgi:hypothetical protein